MFHRKFAMLSVNQDCRVRAYDPKSEKVTYLSTLTLMAAYLRKTVQENEYIDTDDLAKIFLNSFDGHIVSKEQVPRN
jgi:vesicle-fusing ATPase